MLSWLANAWRVPELRRRVLFTGLILALYRLGDGYHATEAYCTHGHALLTEGYIDGAIVECPMHGGTFEIATGKAVGAPCTVPLATYVTLVGFVGAERACAVAKGD